MQRGPANATTFPHFLSSWRRLKTAANSGFSSMVIQVGRTDPTTHPAVLRTDCCGCMLGGTWLNPAGVKMASPASLGVTFSGDGCRKGQAGFTVLPESILGGRPSTPNLSGITEAAVMI